MRDEIRDSIQENHASRKLNILKGFTDLDDVFEKAVYADNAQNQKLGRVGKTYREKKEDEAPQGKQPAKKEEVGGKAPAKKEESGKPEMSHEDITKHLGATSTETLKNFAANPKNDPKLIEHAKRELEVRAKDEGGKEAEKKPVAKAPEKKPAEKKASERKNSKKENESLGELAEAVFNNQGKFDADKVTKIYDDLIAGGMKHEDIENEIGKVSWNEPSEADWADSYKEDWDDAMKKMKSESSKDKLIEGLGEAVFNNQGKLDIDKVKRIYNRLLSAGVKSKEIEKEIGDMTWNEPNAIEDESYKEDWDYVMSKIEDKPKPVKPAKPAKPAKGSYEEKTLQDQKRRQSGGGKQSSFKR